MITDNNYKANKLSKQRIFKIAGVSRSGYYAWLNRLNKRNEERIELEKADNLIKEKMRKTIHKIGYIPGKRSFKLYLQNDFNITVSVKRCRRLMNEMHIKANKPKKDAYKGQATYFHEASSMINHINQNFLIAPRKIVLADITYLYYGIDRLLCYLCTFFDPYTNEVLGYSISKRMDLELVKAAYNMMMLKHGHELHEARPYFHSDQGSVFLASEFRHLLVDDDFIQSMSRRGNSQDNAPMESWFGKLKTRMIDTFARCKDYGTLVEIADGYITSYNNDQYQLCVAGLSPKDYYTYITTGIYPLDKYYGVDKDKLLTPEELKGCRRRIADDKNRKARESEKKERHLKNPLVVVERDQIKIAYEIMKQESIKEAINQKIDSYKNILVKIDIAKNYLQSLPKELLNELSDLSKWRNHKELHYVFDIPAIY